MSTPTSQPETPGLFDWLLLIVIAVFGGSAFVMIRAAVETIAPADITLGRLWIGAIFLYLVMRLGGEKLPPLLEVKGKRKSLSKAWQAMIAVGLIGNTFPFLLFPWAQQFVDSGLAGIYMAFMPIWTLGMAYFFAQEPLTRPKMAGFALGFVGIIILMGPDALRGAASTDLKAQLALLAATFLYAAATVITRRAPVIRPRIFSTGMLLAAAIGATPLLLLTSTPLESWSVTSIVGVVGLGLLPTGVNGILIFILIRRAGAGFMALTNYVTPVLAVAMGAVIYAERLPANAFIALAVILFGLAISQIKRGQTKS